MWLKEIRAYIFEGKNGGKIEISNFFHQKQVYQNGLRGRVTLTTGRLNIAHIAGTFHDTQPTSNTSISTHVNHEWTTQTTQPIIVHGRLQKEKTWNQHH